MTLEDDTVAALEAARARVQAQTARARVVAHDAGRMSQDVKSATATAVATTPITAASETSGWVSRTSSTSRG